jgi:hypothetical protein
MDWNTIIWTEARQVTAFLNWPRVEGDAATPAEFFAELRRAGRDADAVNFLALALPRFAAVQWLRAVMTHHLPAADASTLAKVDDWLRQPADALRRDIFASALALPADETGGNSVAAMVLCASAIFFSGGSIAPESIAASPAPKQATGQFVGAGILLCVSSAKDQEAALDEALRIGNALAASQLDMAR